MSIVSNYILHGGRQMWGPAAIEVLLIDEAVIRLSPELRYKE